MPYLDDVLNPYQSLTGDLTPEDTLTGLLSEDGLLQGALAISDVVGVTQLTELTDVSITNPINHDVLTYNDVTEKWENMPAQGGGGGTSDYDLLDNKPSINSVTLSGNKTTADLNISYNDLDDKPTLATVATTGDYDDLTDKPTIPSVLNDLSDVNINNPYQTDVLSYDESTSKWINHPVSLTVEGLSNVALSTPLAGKVLKISSVSGGVPTWRSSNVKYSEIDNTPTLATVATSGSYDDLTDKPTIPTTCSIEKGSSMPATFPVPNICRRGNTVIIRFSVLLPAGSYTTSQVLWNYTPLMADLPALVFPVYGSAEVNLIKILPNGTITINANKTFSADTWLIGEATFLTDG